MAIPTYDYNIFYQVSTYYYHISYNVSLSTKPHCNEKFCTDYIFKNILDTKLIYLQMLILPVIQNNFT